MTANPLRNEFEVTLCGETYTMRATFDALQQIERELGNLVPLIEQIGSGNVGVKQATAIIFWGLRGYEDTRLNFKEVGER